jgi:hypothetical protein
VLHWFYIVTATCFDPYLNHHQVVFLNTSNTCIITTYIKHDNESWKIPPSTTYNKKHVDYIVTMGQKIYKKILATITCIITILAIKTNMDPYWSRDSVAGIATGYGLDDRGSEFVSWYRLEFSLLHVVQTDSRVNPTSYPMGTVGSFPGGKAAGA